MSDGTKCYSGPTCTRHVARDNRNVVQAAQYKVHNFLNELRAERDRNERFPDYVPWNLEDASFSPNRKVIRGENAPGAESKVLGQLHAETVALKGLVSDELYQKTVGHYTTSYEFMNLGLKFGKVEGIEKYFDGFYRPEDMKTPENRANYYEKFDTRVKHMDSVFTAWGERPERNVRRLYRTVHSNRLGFDDPKSYADSLKVGDVIEEKSYLSTTADSDCMLYLNHPGHKDRGSKVVVYEILSKEGLPIYNAEGYSFSREEREVLLNRGSKFKVAGVVERTFESSYESGFNANPQFASHALKRGRFTVVQLEHIE